MDRYTFLVASSRANGNSETLAKIAASTLDEASHKTWLSLRELPLPPFQDLRHSDEAYQAPEGNARVLFEATTACTDLVFVTPVYWYSVPAPLKLYLDYWSHWMRVDPLDFKNQMREKRLWVIAASAGDADEAEPMFQSLKHSAKFMSMKYQGHVLGNGSAEGDVLNDSEALKKARSLFKPTSQN